MQSTIQETNKPVTTQTHLELLLQPAAAPAPCWACSRHVGPPCAAATRDLLGNSCCSWPSLSLGHLLGWILRRQVPLDWRNMCCEGTNCCAAWMNRGTELNRIAWLTWNEVELHWNEWIEQNEMTWIERKNAWMNANELNWIELRWIELTWSKLMCSELSCNDLNWAEYYFIELTLTHWIELN